MFVLTADRFFLILVVRNTPDYSYQSDFIFLWLPFLAIPSCLINSSFILPDIYTYSINVRWRILARIAYIIHLSNVS